MSTGSKGGGKVVEVAFAEALGTRYLSYALSTIMSRSLPDVRDGLKPVHRRLLYAMRQLHLDPKSGFKKSARVVGDVMGKFHPHGDQAIYDAMVRLAQDFSVRYPLIDGQGNFGNIDGDNAAAMRYTEARLTQVAELLLQDIDEDTVDFRPTYDGEAQEPLVFPAYFPNLLANGAAGIAVGMATSIPPHNAAEVCQALLHLLEHPEAETHELMAFMPGPDFPTGGVIVEPAENLAAAYATGRGSLRLRARWEIEKAGRGQYRIVITEIPYQVQKSRLIEKIADLITARKVALLADVHDESTDEVRLVLEPKSRTVDARILMESLYRLTDLETRVSLNLNVLDADQTPRVMALGEILRAFLDHRVAVLRRRSRFRLAQVEQRIEVLDGLLVAYLNLDEVIRIVRFEDAPKDKLMTRFELSAVQADAILNMRLRALNKLKEVEIRAEHESLMAKARALEALLKSDRRQRREVAKGLTQIAECFGPETELGKRRTGFGAAPASNVVPLEAMIEREPITVICSEKGWIRALRGHAEAGTEVRYKDGDRGRFWLHAQTTDKLLVFATNGRFYTLACDKLPGGRGAGEPVRLMIDLGNEEKVVTLAVYRPGSKLLVASSAGKGFLVEADKVVAATRNGKQVLNVGIHDRAIACMPAKGDAVAVVGTNAKMLIFALDDVPTMTRGQGVRLQRYAKGTIKDVTVFARRDGLTWPAGSRTRTLTDLEPWIGRRGGAGRSVPRGFSKSGRFS